MLVFMQGKLIHVLVCGTIVLTFFINISAAATNLTCYQCERHDEEECDLNDLKPCSSLFDRCAIVIKKDAQGLTIKRQCGLAPCSFGDEMMARGLGMDCDRSKDSYSCVSCCKASGCNKNAASSKSESLLLLIAGVLILCILNIARDFIPPYVMAEHTYLKN